MARMSYSAGALGDLCGTHSRSPQPTQAPRRDLIRRIRGRDTAGNGSEKTYERPRFCSYLLAYLQKLYGNEETCDAHAGEYRAEQNFSGLGNAQNSYWNFFVRIAGRFGYSPGSLIA
jgi:hypothetical protein